MTRVGEGGSCPVAPVDGDGVRLRVGEGDAGIVSSGLSTELACARSLDSEDGPADAEFERVRTGNKWDVGDLVGPSGSAAEAPG